MKVVALDEIYNFYLGGLVCEPWCRLISGPRFRRRYREFHGAPPMLGILCGGCFTSDGVQFVSTSSCRPLADRRCRLVDARHGRVLLPLPLAITDEEREIPLPGRTLHASTWKAAVVCAAAAGGSCDHLDCHRGAFLVVYVVSYSDETFIRTYSSHAGSWSDPISTPHHKDFVDLFLPSVLVGNALYFVFSSITRILKYDLEFHELSVVGLPPGTSFGQHGGVCKTTDDGFLGFATVHKSKLYMWSMKHAPEADDVLWTCDRVIELETLLSSNAILSDPLLVGFVDRIGVILLRADNAIFTVDLKTSKLKKVCDEARRIINIVPYMSFYTPALGVTSTSEGPSVVGSSA